MAVYWLRWILVLVLAFLCGKLMQKIKLPAILGWLIAGMIFGPEGVGILTEDLRASAPYQAITTWMQCAFGIMLGAELIWKKLKAYGKALLITTLTQSLGTFLIVSLAFGIVFAVQDIPLYLALIFGSIALATAPAPALSIVKEFHTKGPVTDTLLPMTILDDVVGIAVFFTVNAFVARQVSGGAVPLYMIPVMIFLPIGIGAVVGYFAGLILKRVKGRAKTLAVLLSGITITVIAGWACSSLLSGITLNYMLMGVSFAAVIFNMLPEVQQQEVYAYFNPFLAISLLASIVDLGAPLNYHLILGAGFYTFLYIAARAAGKYFGARFGATVTGLPVTVRKYLGLTLLPHSGVSLVFTSIACSTLQSARPDLASIIQGTIAAAAVINEIIAVIAAKRGFVLAGEIEGGSRADVKDSSAVSEI